MRLSSIATVVCCAGALILSILCLLAGNTRSFLQNADVLTLNMSRLGYVGDVFNTTNGDGGFLDNLINDAQSELNDLINDATTDIASALNISDFYSVHLMDYCEGMYSPNSTLAAENGTHVSENVTYCSPANALFHFNVTEVVQSVLPDHINLTDIQWPDAITDAQNAVRTASIAAVVLYIVGIALTGIAFFGAIFGFFTNGRISACLNIIIDTLALLALIVGSALATIVMVKAVEAINKYGNDIGISATKGNLFLGMTWASVGLMLIATVISIVQLIRGRRHGAYVSEMHENYKYGK